MELSAGPMLSDQVSAILRTYFVAVLQLPVRELTNRELSAALLAHAKVSPALATRTGALLQALDRCRFDPQPHEPLPDAVEQAVKLVDETEAWLRPAPAAEHAAGKPAA